MILVSLFPLQYEQALKGFIRSRDVEGCAMMKEKSGDYTGAIKLFITFNRRIDALAQAAEYERKGIVLGQEVKVAYLAHTFAKMYSKHKDKTKLLKVLEYMPDASQRIRFLKEAKLYSKACEVHIQQGQYAEAYRLLTAQAKYKDGIDLAEKQGNEEMAARFAVQKAVAELISNGSIKDPNVVKRLQIIAGRPESSQTKAQACLLLGRSNEDASMCRKAFDLYKSFTPACKIGQVESFSAFTKLKPQVDRPLQLIRPVIEACKAAKSIQNAIENRQNPTASFTRILQEVEDFYYLQKQGDVYSFPQSLDLWGKLVECSTAGSEVDPDGMLKLDVTLTLMRISEHLNNYITDWMEQDCMQALKSRLAGFPFHKHLCEGGYLQQSFMTYPPGELKTYIDFCLLSLEADSCGSKLFRSMDVTRILQNLFSPQAAVYLPVSKLHMNPIRRSELVSKGFEKEIAATLGTRDADFKMNQWLEIWRMSCLLGKGTQRIESVLNERQRLENTKAESGNQATYKPSHTSVYSSREKKYQHVFSLFMKSCALIRSDCKVLTASKIVLHFIVKTIANRKSLASSISVGNFVNIVCIHSIALLGLATHCCFLLKQPCIFLVPHTYSHIAQVFDDLNCHTQGDKWLLRACMEDVNIQKCSKSNFPQLTKDILELLQLVLDVLLGRYNRHFYVLRFAIRNLTRLQNGEVKHCLILVLTLFGNLAAFTGSFWSNEQLHHYQREINAALEQLPEQLPEQHPLKHVQKIFASSANVSGAFLALSQLLASGDRSSHLQRFTVVQKQQKVPKLELTQFLLQHLPQRSMIPINQQLHQQTTVQPQSPLTASPQSLQVSSQFTAEVPALPRVLQKLFPGDPLQPQPESPPVQPLASPQQLQPVSDNVQMSSLQAVQGSFDWGQFQVAQAHPLTAQSLASRENLILQQEDQPETQSNIQNVVLDMTVPVATKLPGIQRSMSYPEPEGEEQEEFEHGPDIQDPDIWEAFEESQPNPKSPTTESTVIGVSFTRNYSMIDENFCRFCGVALRHPNVVLIPTVESWEEDEVESEVVEKEEESVAPTVVDNSVETYQDHIESDHHKLQERLYAEFSKEVNDWQYKELSIELKKIQEECESFEEHVDDLELDSAVTAIKALLDKNEKEIENFRRSCEWKAGLWHIQNVIVDQMESLVHRGRKEQKRVQEKIQRLQKEKPDNTPQPETLLEEEDTYDIPEEIEQAIPVDMEGEKTKKRKKKIDRKRKK